MFSWSLPDMWFIVQHIRSVFLEIFDIDLLKSTDIGGIEHDPAVCVSASSCLVEASVCLLGHDFVLRSLAG